MRLGWSRRLLVVMLATTFVWPVPATANDPSPPTAAPTPTIKPTPEPTSTPEPPRSEAPTASPPSSPVPSSAGSTPSDPKPGSTDRGRFTGCRNDESGAHLNWEDGVGRQPSSPTEEHNGLRAGSTGRVLGFSLKAASTLGTFLRSFRWGHVRQLDAVNGTATSFEYDNALRLAQVLHTGIGGSTLEQLSYTLDAVGNVTAIAEGDDGSPRTRARRWPTTCAA